jgi:hypothetical protein
MSKHLIQATRREQFASALRDYKRQHHLTTEALATLLQQPISSVRHWLTGSRCPHKRVAESVCACLNIRYQHLFSPDVFRDIYFDQHVIGLDALQTRYLDLKGRDPLLALHFLVVSAAQVFNQLTSSGILCRLAVEPDLTCVIQMSGNNHKLLIKANGMEGLGYRLLDSSCADVIAWTKISDSSMKDLVDQLISTQ